MDLFELRRERCAMRQYPLGSRQVRPPNIMPAVFVKPRAIYGRDLSQRRSGFAPSHVRNDSSAIIVGDCQAPDWLNVQRLHHNRIVRVRLALVGDLDLVT